MKTETIYRFDFGQPGKIFWSWNNSKRQLEVPENPLQFSINDSAIATTFAAAVDPIFADALDVAVSAHMTDRLALRERFIGKTRIRCHRHLQLTVAVRNPDLWNDIAIKTRLLETLTFLTEDTWEFTFVKRDFGRVSDSQQHLFGPALPTNPDVGLFSGGLDSFAGTAIEFGEPDRNRHFVCVSASPTNIHLGMQRRQFNHLRQIFQRQGTHLAMQYSILGAAKTLQEPSRRSRGFVFLSLGAAVALSAGTDRLHVYENGIGAINLPYDMSQVGIDTTRAMHPRTLRNIALLFSQLTGQTFAIENRSLFKTKADMCRHSAVTTAADAICDTFSCDGLTHTGAHCGFCTSCLLRRESLEAAGLARSDHHLYLNDCTSSAWHPKRRQLRGLLSMTWQAGRLQRCLGSQDSWRELSLEFPELHFAMTELAVGDQYPNAKRDVRAMYQTHVSDWYRFSALQHLPLRTAA